MSCTEDEDTLNPTRKMLLEEKVDECELSGSEIIAAMLSDDDFRNDLKNYGLTNDEEIKCFILKSLDEDYPLPEYSPGLLIVNDKKLYDNLDNLSEEELELIGFFDNEPSPITKPAIEVTDIQQQLADVDFTAYFNKYYRKNPLSRKSKAPSDAPQKAPKEIPIQSSPKEKKKCRCKWVAGKFYDPISGTNKSYPPNPKSTEATGKGSSHNKGPLHRIYDHWINNCFGQDGHSTDTDGTLIITSKVVCDPKGCCTPEGKVKCISSYHSKVSAFTSAGFCFGASSVGNALAADGVEFYVGGSLVPGGSKSILATSGANVIGSITMGVGGGYQVGPDGPTSSGSVSIQVSSTKTKSDGQAKDVINRHGSKTVAQPGVVCNLNAGARTTSYVDGKAEALSEQITNFAGAGQFGFETKCGAGSFWIYEAVYTSGPIGRRRKNAFKRKFNLLKKQFL